MKRKIAVIAELSGKKIKPITFELLSMAQKIHRWEPSRISLFIVGDKIDKLSRCISADTGYDVYAVNTPGHVKYNGSVFKKVLTSLFTKETFDYICAPHSTSGMDYAPALSIALQAECITGVEDVFFEEKKLCIVRSMFGGKLSAKFIKGTTPLVMTLQPGSFKPCPDPKKIKIENTKTGKLTSLIYKTDENKMRFKGTEISAGKGSDLGKADVIVSGGRGIGERENYEYIEMLAKLFPRSATAASRPICDYGWVIYHKQVGMTGAIVSPKLYIACGISGASQHVDGIRDSKFIVAINTDPEAPVFQIADICVVDDAIEFIKLFVEKFKKNSPNS
ncbi:MAG: electron transfer flavoprotein subunit alpha/FixB family protein [Desulfobacteraceae bacterium]|nr:electron transfer flavoprotein subunit alpha/FixB family protein [Desulfobacteraceae bacterium]